jgi:GPH family glycoside/pentoside/hexuronide:cation symporter
MNVPRSTAAPGAQGQRLNNKALFAWAIGNFGTSFMGNSVGHVMRPIFNTGFGMDAILVSWALVLPRLVDAFLDPVLGHLSDITHTRWGRRRPFILVGVLSSAFLMIVMWWMGKGWSPHVQFAFLLGCSMAFGITTTLYALPLGALGYELTDDYHERTKMNAVVVFFTVSAFMLGTWVYWLVLRPVFGSEVNGIRWVSWGLASIVILTGLCPVFFCRERFQQANKVHLPIWLSIKTTLKNRIFRHLIFIKLSMTLGTSVFGGMIFYVNTYYICGGDKSKAMFITGLGGTLYTIVAIAQLPFVTLISRKLGKSEGLRLGLGILLATTFLQPFVQNPNYPYLQILTTVLCAPAFTLSIIFIGAFMPDICDIDEVDTGMRREGTFGAVAGFIDKIEGSFCSLIVGYLIAYAGFNQLIAHQPDDVITKLRWFGYIPNFLFTLIAFGLAWTFPINHTMMEDVRATLNSRRGTVVIAPGD